MEDMEPLPPTIDNIIEQRTLKYIFVGGKGGVGKTTCSCSIATQLALSGRKVLLISTDPAHNLSDAFNQRFGSKPVEVQGIDNLSCLEIDPTEGLEEAIAGAGAEGDQFASMLKNMEISLPGIDEASTFAHIVKMTKTMDFDVVVFDTAPTGHTLRLLQMPGSITKMIEKFLQLNATMGGMLSQVGAMFNMGDQGAIMGKLESLKASIEEVIRLFRDPEQTTFVCVCIAEFLSLYESERLVQELTKMEFDVHNIIVNQLVVPDSAKPCSLCKARAGIQGKYLDQIDELYDDFHVIKLPLREREVRGAEAIIEFSKLLRQDLVVPKVDRS